MPERPAPSSSLSDRARQLLADIRLLSSVTFKCDDPTEHEATARRYEVLTLAPWACSVPCRVTRLPRTAPMLRSAV